MAVICLTRFNLHRKEDDEEAQEKGGGVLGALTEAQCLVRSKTENPETQKERAEVDASA